MSVHTNSHLDVYMVFTGGLTTSRVPHGRETMAFNSPREHSVGHMTVVRINSPSVSLFFRIEPGNNLEQFWVDVTKRSVLTKEPCEERLK